MSDSPASKFFAVGHKKPGDPTHLWVSTDRYNQLYREHQRANDVRFYLLHPFTANRPPESVLARVRELLDLPAPMVEGGEDELERLRRLAG